MTQKKACWGRSDLTPYQHFSRTLRSCTFLWELNLRQEQETSHTHSARGGVPKPNVSFISLPRSKICHGSHCLQELRMGGVDGTFLIETTTALPVCTVTTSKFRVHSTLEQKFSKCIQGPVGGLPRSFRRAVRADLFSIMPQCDLPSFSLFYESRVEFS